MNNHRLIQLTFNYRKRMATGVLIGLLVTTRGSVAHAAQRWNSDVQDHHTAWYTDAGQKVAKAYAAWPYR